MCSSDLNLRSINDDLNAKLEIASKSNSCVENVVTCTRCKDINIDACSEHLARISKLNDEVASLNAQLKTSKSDFDKLKFARDAYTVGRHPSIKDGLGFKREAKNLTSHKASISANEKGKAPMASSTKKNHAFMVINFYEIPVYELNRIKNGADYTLPDGKIVPNNKLTIPSALPRRYAYCSDWLSLDFSNYPKQHVLLFLSAKKSLHPPRQHLL